MKFLVGCFPHLVFALKRFIAVWVEATDEVIAEVQALQARVGGQGIQDEIEALLAEVDACKPQGL